MEPSAPDPRVNLNLWIPASLKARVQAHASGLGVSANTAAILLLRAGLEKSDR